VPGIEPTHRWDLPEPGPDVTPDLAHSLDVPELGMRLLERRGLVTADAIRDYLDPSPARLHKPDTLPDIKPATDRIAAAVAGNERICIHGDYDVDGITGTVLLVTVLRRRGADVVYYLPHRENEGYGLSVTGVEFCREQGVNLLITTDCGSTDHDAVNAANAAGIDVIITDHHETPAELPAAIALVNPKRPDSQYPFADLAGVGVAFKLAWSVLNRLGRPREELTGLLDLVGLGTIADVVPMLGENRILARLGLSAIRDTSRPGLRALLTRNRITDRPVSGYDVGFVIGPRLNAAGRVGHANSAAELLLSDDPATTERLVGELETFNRDRRTIERRVVEEAAALVERHGYHQQRVIVVAHDNWPAGVLGLAASRLADRYWRPSLVIGLTSDIAKGSGRSITGFNLYESLAAGAQHLAGFGGHRQACGLTVEPDRIDDFRAAVNRYADELPAELFERTLNVDAVVSLAELDPDFLRFLARMEPFGPGNRRPVFAALGLEVVGYPRRVGRNHLKLRVRGDDATFDAIAWERSVDLPLVEPGRPGALDICFTIDRRVWQGRTQTSLTLRDLRTSRAN
jgi:single-stranded-DNA-specific exonuclease